ncbi:Regulatory protein AfsR [Methylocystis sp. MJC1]|nr:Regulatory protein AfsR [Methylocystis sp. MJC1]
MSRCIGREDSIERISSALSSSRGRVAITALHGLRGVGKTTLAAAYANRHGARYLTAWWIDAQLTDGIRSALVSLGRQLQWIVDEINEKDAIVTVMSRLNKVNERILLVFDNALDKDFILEFLPVNEAVHVIITSNSHAWGEIANPIEIDVWSPTVGGDYLLTRLKKPEEERAFAEALSHELGGLPLALAQVAAYCDECGDNFDTYLKKLAAAKAKLLQNSRYLAAGYHSDEEQRYLRTVAGTFELASAQATTNENGGIDEGPKVLLNYAAQFASAPIPISIFKQARSTLGKPFVSMGDLDIDDAVAKLRRFAVIYFKQIEDERDASYRPNCIWFHRLIREIVMFQQSPAQQDEIRCRLIAALVEAYPNEVFTNPAVWPGVRHLDIHARYLVFDNPLPKNAQKNKVVYLLNLLGQYQHGAIGDYDQAMKFYTRALDTSKAIVDPFDPIVGMTNHGIGWLCVTMGRYKAARPYFLKALAIRKKALGKDHFDTAETLHRIGWLEVYEGHYKRAEIFLTRACAVRANVPASEYVARTDPFVTMGWMCLCAGRYEEGLSHCLRNRDKMEGQQHAVLAALIYNTGQIYLRLGRYEEADKELQHVRKMREDTLGPEHAETINTLTSLGLLRMEQKRLDEAEFYFEQVRERMKSLEKHPRYARALAGLAEVRLYQNRLVDAEDLAQQAFALRESACAEEHPDRAHSRWLLAKIWIASTDRTKHIEKGKRFLQEAIGLLERKVTEGHVWLKSARATLAEIEELLK